MKIAYVVNARIPTEKAHGYQITRMCAEFSRLGADVTLYVPTRKNTIEKDAFSYYGLPKSFKVEYVRCADTVRLSKVLGKAAFILQTKLFLRSLGSKVARDSIVYTRDPEVVAEYSKRGHKTFYDAHNFPDDPSRLIRLLMGVTGVVANSRGTSEEFAKRGFPRVLSVPNGVDMTEFNIHGDKAEFRKGFGLSREAKVATYVGHLYPWKGIDTVVGAAKLLPRVTFLIVGGTKNDISKYEKVIRDEKIANIILAGHRERKDIPRALKASDVLLLPNSSSSKESEKYTSPLKMFEYMASGVPIIASDLPSLREVLNEKNAILVPADDPKSFADAILSICRDAKRGEELSARALEDVKERTWDKRADRIISFILRP